MKEYWKRVHQEALQRAIAQAVASLVSFVILVVSIVGAIWGLTVFGSPDAARDEMIMRTSVGVISLLSVFLTYLYWIIGIPPKWDADSKNEVAALKDAAAIERGQLQEQIAELNGRLDRRAARDAALIDLARLLGAAKSLVNRRVTNNQELTQFLADEHLWRVNVVAAIAIISRPESIAWDQILRVTPLNHLGHFNLEHNGRLEFINARANDLRDFIRRYSQQNQ